MASSVKTAARVVMQGLAYDPMEVLVRYAKDSSTSDDKKIEIAQVLLPYMYPKLSNVTLEGEVRTEPIQREQAKLLQQILRDPELADAAQRLSIHAAQVLLEADGPETVQ